MEVGALMVGRITNLHTEGGVKVTKGEEKGYFEFGGSTILLLLEKDKVKLCGCGHERGQNCVQNMVAACNGSLS